MRRARGAWGEAMFESHKVFEAHMRCQRCFYESYWLLRIHASPFPLVYCNICNIQETCQLCKIRVLPLVYYLGSFKVLDYILISFHELGVCDTQILNLELFHLGSAVKNAWAIQMPCELDELKTYACFLKFISVGVPTHMNTSKKHIIFTAVLAIIVSKCHSYEV